MGISAYNANLNPQGQTVTVPTSLAGSTDPQKPQRVTNHPVAISAKTVPSRSIGREKEIIGNAGKPEVLIIDDGSHGEVVEGLFSLGVKKEDFNIRRESLSNFAAIWKKVESGEIKQPDIINLSSTQIVRFVDNNTLNGFTSDQEREPKITWADVDSIVKIVESRVNRELAKKFRGTLEANNPEEAFFSELTIQERKMVRNAVFHGIALPDKEKLALLRLIENAHVTSIAADNEPYYVNPLFAFASDKSLESSPQERLEKLKDPKSKGNLLFASAKNTLGITSNYSSIINPLGVQIAQGDYNIYLEKDSNKQYIWQNGEKLYLPKELYETKSTIDLIKKFNGKSFQLSSADTFRKHLGDWMHGTTKQLPVGSIYKIDDVLKGIEQYKLDHNAVRYYPIQIESLKNLNWLAQRVLSNKGQDDYLVIESFGEELYFKGDGQGKLVYNPASEQITTTDQVIGKSTGTSWATPNLAAKKATEFKELQQKIIQEYIKNYKGINQDVPTKEINVVI